MKLLLPMLRWLGLGMLVKLRLTMKIIPEGRFKKRGERRAASLVRANLILAARTRGQGCPRSVFEPALVVPTLAVLAALAVGELLAPSGLVAAEEGGVALAIVYDTSGSMREPVRDTN